MRLRYFVVFLIVSSLSSRLFAQVPQLRERRGRAELAIGAGVSTGSFALAVRLAGKGGFLPEIYDDDLVTLHASPAITIDYQQPFERIFSLGFACSAQYYRVAYEFDHATGGEKQRVDNGDAYTRINAAIRPIFHLSDNPNLNSYLGARAGITIWTLKTSAPFPGYRARKTPKPMPSLQLFYGFRYFFTHRFGAGFELGIGTAPYLAQLNVAYRI